MTRLSSSSPRSSWLGGRFRSVLPSSRRGSISSSVPEKEISIGARWFSVERTLFGFSSSSSSRLRRKNKHASFEAGRGTRLWEDGTTRLFVSSSLCVRGHATRHDRRGRVVLRSTRLRLLVSVGESYISHRGRDSATKGPLQNLPAGLNPQDHEVPFTRPSGRSRHKLL